MKLQPDNIKKIAVFRALHLGDMLCVIPAIRALRHAYPDAEITLLGLPWAKTFVDRFDSYFDRFVHFPGYPGLPEQSFDPIHFTEFLQYIQQQQFDLVLQMQGKGSIVNIMVELFGARYTAGFSVHGYYSKDTDYFMPYPDYGSEIKRHILLTEFLGIPTQGVDLEFPLYEHDIDELNRLQLDIEPGRYVCVHPGSRGASRQWPVQHFAALADFCKEQGYEVLLTGTRDESAIVDNVMNQMHYIPLNTAGKTSVGAVAALIKDAALLISNCTGVSHIAAAFQTPSIVISMDGEPQRWGPINHELHRTINWQQSPNYHFVFRETAQMINLLESGVLLPHAI